MLNGVDPTVSQHEIGSLTQKSKGTGGLVSIVSYSRPSLMIIASRTQFHVERPWGQRPISIVVAVVVAVVAAFNQEKALVGAFSVIVQTVVEPMDRFAALIWISKFAQRRNYTIEEHSW